MVIIGLLILAAILIPLVLLSRHEIQKERLNEKLPHLNSLNFVYNTSASNEYDKSIMPLINTIRQEIKDNNAKLKQFIELRYRRTDPLLTTLEARNSYLNALLSIKATNDISIAFLKWAYNDGDFRSEQEIKCKVEELKRKHLELTEKSVKESEEYKNAYHPFIVFFVTLPFSIIISYGLMCLIIDCSFFILTPIVFMPFFLAPGSIISFIISLIHIKFVNDKYFVTTDKTDVAILAGVALMLANAGSSSSKDFRRSLSNPSKKEI